jgi:hypothetical protein
MHRIAASFALGCLALASVCRATEQPARPITEDTYIIAPRLIGEYVLIKTVNYGDQGQLLGGVALRYHDGLLPPMTTDIYVYPGGGNETLEHAERTFRDSVKLAAERGIYSDVRWGEPLNYDLQRRDGSTWQGRMIPMQVHLKQGDSVSRTYLFHHDLYNYKLRLDVPTSLSAELPAAADALVRTVLQAVQVVSTGSCGRKLTINVLKDVETMPAGYVDGVTPDGFGIVIREAELHPSPTTSVGEAPDREGIARLTLLAAQRQVAQGCTALPYELPSGNVTVLKLHYPADFWQSGPADPKH